MPGRSGSDPLILKKASSARENFEVKEVISMYETRAWGDRLRWLQEQSSDWIGVRSAENADHNVFPRVVLFRVVVFV
jgi:hypothetical protein